jgi:hypothetical protein
MKTLIALTTLTIAAPAVFAQQSAPQLKRLDPKTLVSRNAGIPNFFGSKEVLFASGEGTRGGGSSRLWISRDLSTAFDQERTMVIEAITDVDWSSLADESVRKRIQSVLARDPVQILQKMDIRIQEQCNGAMKHSPVILADDFSALCVEVKVNPEHFTQVWKDVIEALFGTPMLLDKLRRPDNFIRVNGQDEARRLYNVSLPVSASAVSPVRCAGYDANENAVESVYSPGRVGQEVRRHPDGRILIKTADGYAVCE